MNKKTAFLAQPNKRISEWLSLQFGIETISSFEECDLLVFPGGLDVDPNIYGEPAGQRTSFDKKSDKNWIGYYKDAIGKGKKVLGICKGSQFVCVMSGGKIIQHVENHAIFDTHAIKIEDKIFEVTSTHHQMMDLSPLSDKNYELLAYTPEKLSTTYLDGYDDEMATPPDKEVEAVFFNGNGTLSIQFHPEFMHPEDPIHKVIGKWLEKVFSYKTEVLIDKYHPDPSKKSNTKASKASGITKDMIDEFINYYLP